MLSRKFDQRLARATESIGTEQKQRVQAMQKNYDEEQRSTRERMSDDVSIEVEK